MLGQRTRVLIVEDHALLVEGLCTLLANQPRYEVVGVVSDGLQVYTACQQLLPDLVLLDLSLPGMDGIEVIGQLRKRWKSLPIVVLTAATEEWRGQSALKAGALGYVLKQSAQQVLLAAMQYATLGRCYIDPALKIPHTAEDTNRPGVGIDLTLRERQVLKLVAEGKRNREIAEILCVGLKTVESHRLNLMRKLDAHNAAELSAWARRLGMLPA